jgi:YbbR domain-containing protein
MTPIALAIVSLIAALALWVAVTESENPTTDKELPFTIPIEPVGVPDSLAVYSMSPDAVSVTARATDTTLTKLTASNFRATVNMTGIRDTQSTQSIVVEVVGIQDKVDIVEVSSRFTRVSLETRVSKTVPVQVNRLGSLAQGFTIAATETSPKQVTVVGPATSVDLVQHADADVNLTGVRSNIDLQYSLTPRDAGGAVQPRVTVQPSSAEVKMTVQQLETPQTVPVQAQVQGEVANGYYITSIKPDPPAVLVTGPLETLQSLDSLLTEPIDVGGANKTLTRTVNLQVPDGVQASRDTVDVVVDIKPSPGSRAITVAPVVTNVPDGLNAVLQTSSLTVRVSGDTPVINELTPGDIQATVDASGLTEGVHSIDVKVVVPDDVTLDAVEPQQAVIALNP